MELQHFSHDHKLVFNVKNNLDPDERISCLCLICNLPIFSTPYYSCSSGCRNLFIHQQCTRLSRRIKHVSRGYFDAEVVPGSQYCYKCYRKCGNVRWGRGSTGNIHGLDALCAVPLEIRIFHKSHEHELIPTMYEGDFTVCHACGLRHEKDLLMRLSLFYWCWWCRFWIHENCATLPNSIQHHKHHDHPLALTYALPRGDRYIYYCGICSSTITSFGVYFCWTCSYYAHIKCATRRSELYELVPSCEIGDQSGDYIQFPMKDEDTSLVAHILEKTRYQLNKKLENICGKHDHPLVFNATSANPGQPLLCNGCVQPISSPYYSCFQCTDYHLHESCAYLPPSIVHPAHIQHTLNLITKYNRSLYFMCDGCWVSCNGFCYSCESCDFRLDVQCAFLPKSITHKAHDKRHVLHLDRDGAYTKNNCCSRRLFRGLQYTCTRCDFTIHGSCAGLPMSARHKFDKHPLKLIADRPTITDHHWDNYSEECRNSNIIAAMSSSVQQQQSYSDKINFCEFCEKKINSEYWYYHCVG